MTLFLSLIAIALCGTTLYVVYQIRKDVSSLTNAIRLSYHVDTENMQDVPSNTLAEKMIQAEEERKGDTVITNLY